MSVGVPGSRPMEVFWTSDDTSSTTSVLAHVPGVNDIGNERPQKTRGIRSDTALNTKFPTRRRVKNTRTAGLEDSKEAIPRGKHERKASLKDLCTEDKKRVANLIKELAKTGLEKETALDQLDKERQLFEQQIRTLQEQQEKIINERKMLQGQYDDCQKVLVNYQKQIVEQQDRLSTSIEQLTTPKVKAKVKDDGLATKAGAELYTPQREENNVDKWNGSRREGYNMPQLRAAERQDYRQHPNNDQREEYRTPPARRAQREGYNMTPPRVAEREGRPQPNNDQREEYRTPPTRRAPQRDHLYNDYSTVDTPNHPYTKNIDREIQQRSQMGYNPAQRMYPEQYNDQEYIDDRVVDDRGGYNYGADYNGNNKPLRQPIYNDYNDHRRNQRNVNTYREDRNFDDYNGDLIQPLPEPVMTSTQASQYVPSHHADFRPLHPDSSAPSGDDFRNYRDLSNVLNNTKESVRDKMLTKVRWADCHPRKKENGLGSPISTNFHDHLDTVGTSEHYRKLTPEQRKSELLRQREALMREQERLRTVLIEQESKLKSKQEQLQEQHRVQRARLWHFEKTGQFPSGGDDGLLDPQMSSVDNMILDGTLEGDNLFQGSAKNMSKESVHGSYRVPPPDNPDPYIYSILKEPQNQHSNAGSHSETEENLHFLSRRGVDVSALSPARNQGKEARSRLADRSLNKHAHNSSSTSSVKPVDRSINRHPHNSSSSSSVRVDVATSPMRNRSLKQGNRHPPSALLGGQGQPTEGHHSILRSPPKTRSLVDLVDMVESDHNRVRTPDDLFDDNEESAEESQVLEEIFFLK